MPTATKRAATPKTAANRKPSGAKQSLPQVYDEVEKILREFSPPFTRADQAVKGKRSYGLWSKKPVIIEGRKRDEVWFAGVIEQKGYVGFYYMPIYMVPNMKDIAPELLGLLKGKSCFHVKSLPPGLSGQIRSALKAGVKVYKQHGWV